MAKENNRKTITGGDVVIAMGEMEFDKFVRPLENSLASRNDNIGAHVIVRVVGWVPNFL